MKNKVLCILLMIILISSFFLNNIAFAIEFLEDGYPEMDFLERVTYNEEKNYYTYLGSETICTDYCILYSEQYKRFNVMFFSEGMYINGNTFCFTNTSKVNYFNLEYSSDGSFHHVTNGGSIQSGFSGWWSYICYSTCDIYFSDGSLLIGGGNSSDAKPFIANTSEDLSNQSSDYVAIFPGSYSSSDNFTFEILKEVKGTNSDGIAINTLNSVYKTVLNSSSKYYKSVTVKGETDFWYEVSLESLGINFKNGDKYIFSLYDDTFTQEVHVTIGGLTEEDLLNNKFNSLSQSIEKSNEKVQQSIDKQTETIEKQTEAIEKNNETNKNIFEKIGDILSYINPFSENFFVYKLIELLIEALKSLFVPSEDFFRNWLDDLNAYFGETFGILYFPLQIVIDFLNRIGSIVDSGTAIISVPEFNLSLMGYSVTIFENMSFDLNTILQNSTFKTLHDIYLIFTDIILWLCVIYLASKMINTVIGGMGDAVADDLSNSDEALDERAYTNYARNQRAKDRYDNEQFEKNRNKKKTKIGF